MASFFGTALIIFTVFGVSFLLINLCHLVKGEEFRGTCASASPAVTNEIGVCTMCGAKPGETCANPEPEK